jgi:hypothetical protein
MVIPAAIFVRNSFCYQDLSGTSKGNTGIAHFVLMYIKKHKEATGSTNKDHAILVPYTKQRKNYMRELLTAGTEFEGVTIATANSFQAWEKLFVHFDIVAAKNLSGKSRLVAVRHRSSVIFTGLVRHRPSVFTEIKDVYLFRRIRPTPMMTIRIRQILTKDIVLIP